MTQKSIDMTIIFNHDDADCEEDADDVEDKNVSPDSLFLQVDS